MDIFGIALSGLNASSAGLKVQASNVANQLSDGYKAKRVDLVAEASGGVRVSAGSSDPTPAGSGVGSGSSSGSVPSNVDITSETVQGMGYDFMYKANLKVLKTADDLMKATLDLKA